MGICRPKKRQESFHVLVSKSMVTWIPPEKKNPHEDGSLEGWDVMICFELLISYDMFMHFGTRYSCDMLHSKFFFSQFVSMPWDGDSIQFFLDKTEVLQPVVFWWVFSTCWCSWMPYKQPLSGFQNAGTRRLRKRCKGAVFFGAMVWGCLQEKTNKKDSICVIEKSDVQCETSHGEDEFEWFWGTFASPLEKNMVV